MRKPSVSKASVVLHSLIMGGALLVAWFLWTRGQPERLLDLGDPAPEFSVSGGTLYWPAYRDTWNQKGPFILACPIRSRTERIVLEEDWRYQFSAARCFAVRDGMLLYALSPRSKNLPPGFGGFPGPQVYPGGFRLPPKKLLRALKGLSAGASIVYPPVSNDIRFRSVHAAGGTPRDLARVKGRSVFLVGRYAFWIRPGLEMPLHLAFGQQVQGRAVGRGDLMLTSLADGSTRLLRSGISVNTMPVPGETGIFWTEPRPHPDVAQELFFCRAVDGSPRRMGVVRADQTAMCCTEHQGRLYWLQTSREAIATGSDFGVLMSANLDGTGIREVLSLSSAHRAVVPDSHSLTNYQGALYCLLTDRWSASQDEDQRPICLCRLHPDSAQPLEVVWKLPARVNHFHFDQGYLYFVWRERYHGAWAALTGDDTSGPVTNSLCRVPLGR